MMNESDGEEGEDSIDAVLNRGTSGIENRSRSVLEDEEVGMGGCCC